MSVLWRGLFDAASAILWVVSRRIGIHGLERGMFLTGVFQQEWGCQIHHCCPLLRKVTSGVH